MIILIAVAVFYFGLLYAAPGPPKTVAEPAHVSTQPKIFRSLALGIAIFFVLDGVIFHSGLYTAILKPKSEAGRIAIELRAEKRRARSAEKEILLIGDSRIGRGFSSDMANEMAAEKNVAFVQHVMPGSGPRTWHYFLREIDPARGRYQMIVVPLTPEDIHSSWQSDDRPSDIFRTAPLLHYSDAISFASSFHEWRDRSRAFTACILRGTAYRWDLFDLLEQPAARIRDLRVDAQNELRRAQKGRRGRARLLSARGRAKEIMPPPLADRNDRLDWLDSHMRSGRNNYTWSKRIAQRYASSETAIVFVRLPRGPLASSLQPMPPTTAEEWLSSHATMLDYDMFQFLETSEYFADGLHLNQNGRAAFTKRLTEELFARLQVSSPDIASDLVQRQSQ